MAQARPIRKSTLRMRHRGASSAGVTAVRSHPIRRATSADLDALIALENDVFNYDRMSRRSARQFMTSGRAALRVVVDGTLKGYALVIFRTGSRRARLYSIAVARSEMGQGIGVALLASAERVARRRRCAVISLEVQKRNLRAIRRYQRAGYQQVGRKLGFYEDGGDALVFEKALYPPPIRARGRKPRF